MSDETRRWLRAAQCMPSHPSACNRWQQPLLKLMIASTTANGIWNVLAAIRRIIPDCGLFYRYLFPDFISETEEAISSRSR